MSISTNSQSSVTASSSASIVFSRAVSAPAPPRCAESNGRAAVIVSSVIGSRSALRLEDGRPAGAVGEEQDRHDAQCGDGPHRPIERHVEDRRVRGGVDIAGDAEEGEDQGQRNGYRRGDGGQTLPAALQLLALTG